MLVKVKRPSQISRSFQKTTRDINNCLDMHPLLRNWQMEKRHHSNHTLLGKWTKLKLTLRLSLGNGSMRIANVKILKIKKGLMRRFCSKLGLVIRMSPPQRPKQAKSRLLRLSQRSLRDRYKPPQLKSIRNHLHPKFWLSITQLARISKTLMQGKGSKAATVSYNRPEKSWSNTPHQAPHRSTSDLFHRLF